jgi:hypothetical protein
MFLFIQRNSDRVLFLTRRKTSANAESLEAYRDLIQTATADLQDHLQRIDDKFETVFGNSASRSDSDAAELQLINDERASTKKCLQICAQLSDHIDQIQLPSNLEDSSSGHMDPDALPERLTNDVLQECKRNLALTAAKLEKHMTYVIDRLVAKTKTGMASGEDGEDLVILRDQWDAARQCMDVCSKADAHLKENISTFDNYGTGDSLQFMVSTDGTIIRGRNRGLGWRTRQVGGHLNDASLQQLSRDFSNISFQNIESESSRSRGNDTSGLKDGVEKPPNPEFNGRYGPGFKLPSTVSEDTSLSSPGATEAKPTNSSNR